MQNDNTLSGFGVISQKMSQLVWMGLSFIAVIFLFCFYPYAQGASDVRASLSHFVWMYSALDDWGHCRFIPLIIAFLIYLKRNEFAKYPLAGSVWGLYVLVLSGLMYWVGYVVNDYYIGYGSIQLMLLGMILWMAGIQWTRLLIFELMFLTFMWPLLFLDGIVAFPLRKLVTLLAYFVLNVIGIDCVKVGTALISAAQPELGIREGAKFSLEVANPCSGIRSLFALLMVSSLYGYLMFKAVWQRWVIFFSAVILAILGNLARIVMLTFGTLFFGTEFAIGTMENPSAFHTGAGLLVYVVALIGLVACGWLTEQNWKQIFAKWKNRQKSKPVEGHQTSSKDW